MPAPIVERIVAFCARYPGLVLLAALLLGILAGIYSAGHFAMNTDPAALISAQTTWRKRDAVYDANFPQFNNTIDIVLDGATPELAERGTAALDAAMTPRRDLFLTVRRPDVSSFFGREGLLYLPLADVRTTTQQLIAGQPFHLHA